MKYQSILKNDIPITKFDEDKLNRQKFALQIRKIIKNYKNKECLTLGVMGPWGSGKTSLINMVFDQNKDNILNKKEFKIIRFNPWNFSRQQDLYLQFFEQLKDLLVSNENDEGKQKQVKNVINKYWEKIRYNGTVTLSYSGISYSKPLGEKTLETRKKEINKTLHSLRYKIIIIIDDIDRLTDDEVQQIFILVKALADFPNIIYILPFDRNIILNSMENMQKDYGEEFLDKIVQLQIDIPKIPQSRVQNIFKKELETFIQNEGFDLTSEDRNLWPILPFLTNMRDVNRYINNLIFYLPIMKNEVNPFDHIVLTGLQLFENKIYHEIKNNKNFFTRDLLTKPDRDILTKYQEYYENVLGKCEKLSENSLDEILRSLFPQLKNLELNWDLTNQVSNWNSQLRLCSYDMFDKYFELTLGENEMSNSFFEMIIESEDYAFIKQEVLKNDAEGKSEDFLKKLKNNAEKIQKKDIKLYFRLLYDIGDNLDIETGSIIFSKNTLLLQTIGSLSKQLNNEELFDAMNYGIKNAEECLYLLVDDLAIHDQKNQRYRFKNQESFGQKELSNEQLDGLEKLACIKIKKWAEEDKIFNVYRPIEVIYEWYFWDRKEYDNFIDKTVQSDDKIIELIAIFIKRVDNKNGKIDIEFNYEIMEEITPIKIIFDKITQIIPKLPSESDEKLICRSFIKSFDNN